MVCNLKLKVNNIVCVYLGQAFDADGHDISYTYTARTNIFEISSERTCTTSYTFTEDTCNYEIVNEHRHSFTHALTIKSSSERANYAR